MATLAGKVRILDRPEGRRPDGLVFLGLLVILVGLGLGLVATPTLIAAQSSVEWDERGVVTGANLFSRSVGSAVGVAIFGAVANGIFLAAGPTVSRASTAYPATVEAASGAVFLAVVITAAFTVAAAVSMPRTPPRNRPV